MNGAQVRSPAGVATVPTVLVDTRRQRRLIKHVGGAEITLPCSFETVRHKGSVAEPKCLLGAKALNRCAIAEARLGRGGVNQGGDHR